MIHALVADTRSKLHTQAQMSTPAQSVPVKSPEIELTRKVRALQSAAAYPDAGVAAVVSIETHFAWVFLAGDYAYKLKKPSSNPLNDLRSLDARRLSCEEELRLNRPLAGDVYLGVTPLVQGADGTLRVGADGTVVDWLVRMQRLPAALMLDRAIASGAAVPARLSALGLWLAQFYRRQPRAALDPDQYVERIAEQIRCDRHALFAPELKLDDHHVQSALAATWRAFAGIEDELRERASASRIVEAHGDLKPEHICLIDPPCVIDALDFSKDLRIMDPAEELSYLWIECERLGGAQAAAYVLEGYCRASRDQVSERLLNFYRARRAMVRAKIVAWHLLDPSVMTTAPWRELAHTYLATAESHAQQVV
jgi:aminoglycoside phosphotransferase family enzyme